MIDFILIFYSVKKMLTKNNSAEDNEHERVSTLEESDPDDEPESDPWGLEADADPDDDPYMDEAESILNK
jgi:hypothetical protein